MCVEASGTAAVMTPLCALPGKACSAEAAGSPCIWGGQNHNNPSNAGIDFDQSGASSALLHLDCSVPAWQTWARRSSALLSVIKVILIVAAVVLTTASRTYAAHSGAECYLHGHRIYVPDGLNYPRQAWAGWGITCRTATPEIAAGSGAIGSDSGERPVEWCGWWMRQHLGGRYGPEFNIARNWLNVGRPIDGPRPGAIGVKAHHVFQVIRVVDRDHVLAISGNDHNDVRTRIRPTSDVIGWRDVTEQNTAADKPAADTATTDKTAADKVGSDKSADDASAQGP